jgi:archaellum component FlaC
MPEEPVWLTAASSAGAMLPYCFYVLGVTWRGEARITEHLLDSPYFLGFMLTLMSLTLSLANYEGTRPGELLPGIGTAVFTTVVGLVFRFLAVSVAYQRSMVERDIAALEAELRSSAQGFAAAQVGLVESLRDFTDRRNTMFEQEELAWNRLTRTLAEATVRIDDQLGSFTSTMERTTSDANDSLSTTSRSLSSMKETLANVASEAEGLSRAGHFSSLSNDFGELHRRADSVGTELERLRTALTALGDPANRTKQDLETIDQMLDEFVTIVSKHLQQGAR